jgi:hypothetical protein
MPERAAAPPSQSCKTGRVKDEQCLCRGACCTPGKLCLCKDGERRYLGKGKQKAKAEGKDEPRKRRNGRLRNGSTLPSW